MIPLPMGKWMAVMMWIVLGAALPAWAEPPAPLAPDQIQARVSQGAAGVPALVEDLGRVNWADVLDNCGDSFGAGLLQVTRDLARGSAACARAFSDVLKAPATTSGQRFGLLHGIASLDRVPPVLYDGLVASLSDRNPANRMRASEILARLGDRRAAAAIKAAMRREPDSSTRHRMAYHLFLLGDAEGDPLGLHR